MFVCDVCNLIHVRHLPEQMNRKNRTRPPGDFRFNLFWIDIERSRVDIDKDRSGSEPGNGTRGGKEAVRRGDYLVAGMDIQRHQCDEQSIGSRGNSDCIATLAILGDLLLELFDLWSQNKPLRLRHAIDRFSNFAANRRVLCLQVKQRNHRTSILLRLYAAKACSAVISFIQAWVRILQYPKLQPIHKRSSRRRTIASLPKGHQRDFTVGPIKLSVGIPRSPARCSGPELLQISMELF